MAFEKKYGIAKDKHTFPILDLPLITPILVEGGGDD